MSSPLTVIYEFDRFRLDRRNRRITRDGIFVSMPGRTLPLLVELIENRDHMVSVEKLVNSFFPKSPLGEEELASEVAQLKRLLDDTSADKPIIRFKSGQGYQFEAEVTEYLGDSARDTLFGSRENRETGSGYADSRGSTGGSGKKTALAVAAVILVAALGAGIWRFLPSRTGAGSTSSDSSDSWSGGSTWTGETPKIAVLPFQSLTGAAGDDTFNRSLTAAIMSALRKQPKLAVVPADSVQHYLESGGTDPISAGNELGAKMIVRGMAQRLAGRILIKVQLISAQDGSQVWSNGFEGELKDMPGLCAQISEKIAKSSATDENGEPQ